MTGKVVGFVTNLSKDRIAQPLLSSLEQIDSSSPSRVMTAVSASGLHAVMR